ncbi:RTA1 like protein-domain-containing protein [Halteromyces radiatus]|uniref:RTA1 like protein-domain-containing protein n=1 Tax=Halteromyces radiatus TaxID=101107 RepID=UPI002220872A|nr:RTA1 like protein-domain-containing protein [Halteromyces radiatus]KAI8076369.1 RTA1 like protein-domain-containing protein [Halteromyces radiatus]
MESDQEAIDYFYYQPIDIVPELFIAMFAVITLAFVYRIHRSKCGKWLYILPGTAVAEAIGYGFRTACVYQTTLVKYIMMHLFLLLAPNALAVVNYKTLAKIIAIQTDQQINIGSSITHPSDPFYLSPKFITRLFFSSDILSFLLQGIGGGLQAKHDDMQTIGQIIILIGIAIQLIFFALFMMMSIYVYHQSRFDYRVVDIRSLTLVEIPCAKKKVMACLFTTIVLQYIRFVYWVVDITTGYDGPIATTEWTFYVFDGVAIIGCFLVYYILFIGNLIPNNEHLLVIHAPISQIQLADLYR